MTRRTSEADGDIVVLGSGAVVEQLLAADLVDGLHLYVHPLVLGSGHELLPRCEQPMRLQLDEVHYTATGVVELRYTTVR